MLPIGTRMTLLQEGFLHSSAEQAIPLLQIYDLMTLRHSTLGLAAQLSHRQLNRQTLMKEPGFGIGHAKQSVLRDLPIF